MKGQYTPTFSYAGGLSPCLSTFYVFLCVITLELESNIPNFYITF